MSAVVFAAVLLAALLHAAWNAAVKGSNDKYVSMTAVVVGQGLFGVPPLLVVAPPDPASYRLLTLGALLHVVYGLLLIWAYGVGDLTQVYPVARGSAPMIVTLISAVFLGVTFTVGEVVAVALIGVGIVSLAAVGGHASTAAIVPALAVGWCIAGYSLVDGLGARTAVSPLGYYCWESIIAAVAFAGVMAVRRPGIFHQVARTGAMVTLVGGGASFIAYATVIWAFTQAPIALVTALREASIVFAMAIGVVFLGERVSKRKLASVLVIVTGVALLRVAP